MIVIVSAELVVKMGRVDADGEVVNVTPVTAPIAKLSHEEFDRAVKRVRRKRAEVERVYTEGRRDARGLPPGES